MQAPCVEVLPAARKLLIHTKTALELWRLGSVVDREPPKDGSRRFLKVVEPPRKVLVIEPQDNEIIITCAASPNASWLAYSLTNSMKIFNLELVSCDVFSRDKLAKMVNERKITFACCALQIMEGRSRGVSLHFCIIYHIVIFLLHPFRPLRIVHLLVNCFLCSCRHPY